MSDSPNTVLVPLPAVPGGPVHLFTTDQLQHYADDAIKDMDPNHSNIVKFGVDASGVDVALVMKRGVGPATVSFQAAFAVDTKGHPAAGVGGKVTW